MKNRSTVQVWCLAILRAGLAGALVLGGVTANAVGHCQSDERAIFSCALGNGKTVSVCSSQALSADEGYLQYRYGRAGRTELEYPTSRNGSRTRFEFEGHRPYQGEYENLEFEKDGHCYSVYRVLTNEPGQKNSAGIRVHRLNADQTAPLVDALCKAPLVPPSMGLEMIVNEAK
ncbi:MAG: hypothetical protein EOO80_00795 [Oxalobacteraceae bacterium]|nr:MAG: hypothetical protein EOO80_00795 [Oxalobacteraceae bacterium]